MSEHIELTETCGLLTVPGIREYVCRLEPVGDDTVNVTVCAPTEPIVRCRDCKRCEHIEYTFKGHENEWWSCTRDWSGEDTASVVDPDGFCAWGERRDA